jgi:hypothetical protein
VVTGYCFRRCGVWISFDSVVTDLGYDCVLTRCVGRCVDGGGDCVLFLVHASWL